MKMKRILSLLVVFALLSGLLTAMPAFAATSGYCGGEGDGTNLKWELSSDGTLTISGTGAMRDWDWDPSMNRIRAPWYSKNDSIIKKVSITDGVTSIGYGAFENSDRLTEITIPGSVTDIGWLAFYGCDRLTEITIPGSVTSIGNEAFKFCERLTDVTIADGVTTIGDEAFCSCDSLTEITIPGSVTFIGDEAFCSCDSLTDITVDSQNVNYSSRDGVLFNKNQTTLICYPSRKTASFYDIPTSVTSVEESAFCHCTSLTEITIPGSVTFIGDEAFHRCTSLTSIAIPTSVTSIEYWVFRDCTSLTDVTIPASVTSIGEYTFSGCTSLTDVYYGGSESQWREIQIGRYNNALTNAKIHYNTIKGKYPQEPVADKKIGSAYGEFLEMAEPVGVIPGLTSGVVPQGVAYRADKNQIYLSGYMDNKTGPSMIAVLNADTGTQVGEYYLHKADGSAFTGHAGGIAIGCGNLYVTDGKGLSVVPLSQIDGVGSQGDLRFTETVKLSLGSAGLSFCSINNGMLWVGNFYEANDYPDYAYQDSYHTLLLGYKLDNSSANGFNASRKTYKTDTYDYVPDIACVSPWTKIQGAAATSKKLLLSQSYGRKSDSRLYICKLPTADMATNVLTLDNGRQVPLVTLDDLQTVKVPPMMEDLEAAGDSVYATFESGANKYSAGWYSVNSPTDKVWKLSIRNGSEAACPVIVLPGIMGSTLKSGGGLLGVPTLTENLNFVPQSDMEIADSIAADTGANDFIAALRKDGHTVYDCPYDWRLSIDKAAELYLKPTIDKALKNSTADKVILVAHSMGGLVSRSYIQSSYYGNDVEALYMLGTPNEGAASIVPLAEHGVPYDGSQAVVLYYNYAKMTGESYRTASQAEVKNFVNKKIVGATQLLPTYGAAYFDTKKNAGVYGNVSNSFLKNLNAQAASSGRYQKIDGSASNKVRTLLIASTSENDTPQAIKVTTQNGKLQIPYSKLWIENAIGHIENVLKHKKYVNIVNGIGDGTVLLASAAGDADTLNQLWTVNSGGYGEHMKMMKSLKSKVQGLLCDKTRAISLNDTEEAILNNIQLFADGEPETTTLEHTIQIDVTGAAAELSASDSEESIGISDGYSSDTFEDGEYTIEARKVSDAERSTIQLAYSNGEAVQMETFSFLNEINHLNFTVENGNLTLNNRTVRHLRSVNSNGNATLRWDADENALSYNVYAKPYEAECYSLLGSTAETSYQTADGWLSEFSDDCMNYLVIPVYEDGEGGYDTSAHNYNNSEALFDYEINGSTVKFIDQSKGEITGWEWDFDSDGTIDSREQNPSYTYADGTYSVTLTVSGPSGTSVTTADSIIKVGNYLEALHVTNPQGLLKPGGTLSLTVQGEAPDGSIMTELSGISYFSGDETVVTVDESGTVQGVAPGTVYITVLCQDVQTLFEVEVTEKPYAVLDITRTEDGVAVQLAKLDNTAGLLLAAAYNADGVLLDLQILEISVEEAIGQPVELPLNTEGATRVSAFVWENATNLRPISKKCSKDLQ